VLAQNRQSQSNEGSIMSSKHCVLLAVVVALFAAGSESYGDELESQVHNAVYGPVAPVLAPLIGPADSGSSGGEECSDPGPSLGVASLDTTEVGLCLSGVGSFEAMAREFRREQAEERRQRRLEREREARRRRKRELRQRQRDALRSGTPVTITPGRNVRFISEGEASLPRTAPPPVLDAIEAANSIADTPYIWGGGHGSFESSGYDCSGAVSFALHGGGMLSSTLVSGELAGWGEPGPGKWITIYANEDHAWMTIGGLAFDTVGGPGPRWHSEPTDSAAGFVVSHPPGY
jgi:hypothetical protein